MSFSKYLLAGGGTSGHINPALAIAEEIRRHEPDAEIVFCGTARGLESEMIPRAGYDFRQIRARGLPRRLNLDTIAALKEIFAGRKQCMELIRELKPDAVIGTGGYVCSPLISAAARLKTPALLHEQNAYPGRSNRVLAGRCQSVCVSFPDMERYFRTRAPIIFTGNPVREVFFQLDRKQARQKLNLPADEKIVLIMGGSLGAATLNQAVLGLAADEKWQSYKNNSHNKIRLVLAAGRQHYSNVKEEAESRSLACDIHEYLFEAHLWMAAADLVVARAGAMTCAELAALGRPSVLIPYPYAAGDHQTYNAKALADVGAAIMQADDNCTAEWLSESLINLLADSEKLQAMGTSAKKLAKPEAAASIYSAIKEIKK